MKKQNGITLVAMIITIIVMIILAGVVIVTATMEGGIIDKAQAAMIENERTELEEIVIASYVHKPVAALNNAGQLDLKETAKAIYANLEESEYTLVKSTAGEGKGTYEDIYAEGASSITLRVRGQQANYEGIIEKNGLKDGMQIAEGEFEIPSGDASDTTAEEEIGNVEWVYIDYWGDGEEELRYIGSSKKIELIEDKEVKAYVGTLDEETEEMVYDENCEIISIKLSEVTYIFYEDIEELTVGKLAKNISSFDGARKVIILKEFGDVLADTFDDRGIEEVVIEEGIKNIESSAFGKNDLISVTLPKSIESIGNYAFSYSFKLEKINYAGTMSQWENIEKGTSIVNSSLNVKLICSDGTIEL